MWKYVTCRTERELCAELNTAGVTDAQILIRGGHLTAVFLDQAAEADPAKPKKVAKTKIKYSKEGDS